MFTRPASTPKRAPAERLPHAKRGDADNVAKAVMDAAEGLLYTRDAQVARLTVEKWVAARGEAPSLEVRIASVEELRALESYVVGEQRGSIWQPEAV